MNQHLFVSGRSSLLANWASAFEQRAILARQLEAVDGLVWLDGSTLSAADIDAALASLRESAGRAVVMTATPEVDRAAVLMNAGAVGYCHVYAVADQLRGIELVVDNGGVWLPPTLMQRILGVSVGVLGSTSAPAPPIGASGFEALSVREREVATEVARGANNREIAERLGVSERTVKAHLSTTFEKLGVRDRVQLALLMNNIEIA